MRRLPIILTLFLAFQALALQQAPLYTVLYTYDGDTVKAVGIKGDTIKIRFQGIDCPETGALYSAKARALTDSLVHLGKIEVESHGQDRYGRTLADLYVVSAGERIHINLRLVERGLAWHYKKYDNRESFAEAEVKARNAKIGLWGQPNPVPPWEYRAAKR